MFRAREVRRLRGPGERRLIASGDRHGIGVEHEVTGVEK